MADLPKHWKGISWERMARENPLFAVMSTREMVDAPPDGFSPELLESFFAKGHKVFRKFMAAPVSHSPDPREEALVVEYGCGMGRILKAAAAAGYRTAGIDISPTMLEHCRRLVPEAEALYALDETGRSAMPDGAASAVVSYAVVQHIASLKNYMAAIDEMCRVLKPGGTLAIQVNCKDFEDGDLANPGRTENFEDHSLHYRPGEEVAYQSHGQNQWSGVYIGQELLRRRLKARGVKAGGWRYHNPQKPLAVWITGQKRPAA